MKNSIPDEFICQSCGVDMRVAGVYERATVVYRYDDDAKKFVPLDVEKPDGDDFLFCNSCLDEIEDDSELKKTIDRRINIVTKIRYGNVYKEISCEQYNTVCSMN